VRKQVVNMDSAIASNSGAAWFDLQGLATVEITSENPDYPVESALVLQGGPGWRAAQPGETDYL
jgi:hypothetical protein